MRPLDWYVLIATVLSIVLYGMYKGRGSKDLKSYLLADRSMKWYTIALAIMATQASAITFTSTPGQAYADGMRFVQYYFGLPIAMVILSITAVPLYHKLNVYTAYEYLEHRFDAKTRTLTGAIFLIQRGIGAGMTIYAPSLILSVMLGWDVRLTSTIIGGAFIIYTTTGGIKAVNWTDFQQLLIIMLGMILAFVMTIYLLPDDVSVVDALYVAGATQKLNILDFSFDLTNRYNIWSGVIGGMFIALAYFGTDQSQVQRYLTGASVAQSRFALMFNGLAKVPMQFFILFIGVLVFVFYQFQTPPLFFNPVETEKIRSSEYAGEYADLERRYHEAAQEKSDLLRHYVDVRKEGNEEELSEARAAVNDVRQEEQEIREAGIGLMKANDPSMDPSDTNYVFLSFVLAFLPAGVVGLILACVFAASMSSSSGELSALATTSVVDIYKRHWKKSADERHYVRVSRLAMAGWGIYGIIFAQYASRLGSLIEAVNIMGSLFYGTMLGIFLLAFYFKSIGGTATFFAALVGEAVVLAFFVWSDVSWLWYNVIGCGAVIAAAAAIQFLVLRSSANRKT